MPDDPIPEPTPAPPPAPAANGPSARRPLAWIAVGALALGVAGGGAAAVALTGDEAPDRLAVAAAAEGEADQPAADGERPEGRRPDHAEHHRPGVHGTVAGVDGTTVTVEDDEGTATTVTTDDDTRVLDVVEGEVGDVAEGDSVIVMGEAAEDAEGDAVTAARVVDLGTLDPDELRPDRPTPPVDPPEPPADAPDAPDAPDHEHRARFRPTIGTVASVADGGFTVTTDDGDVAVTTTDETVVTVVTEIAVSDLAEGDTVFAGGEAGDDGTVAAEVVIRSELDGPGFGGPGFGGPGFGPGGPGRPGGPGGWARHGEGERPDAPADEGTTTTTEA